MTLGLAELGDGLSFGDGRAAISTTGYYSQRSYRFAPPTPDGATRTGIIFNARARHNIDREVECLRGPACAMPRDHAELHQVLASFARRGVNLLVIDGGDGTVRDVVSAAARHFPAGFPRVAIIPSGKTNALAADLGISRGWTIQSALNAAQAGNVAERAPIEISWTGSSAERLRGFIFGSGAFVRATALAQTTHRVGAFNGLAVGLSIAGGIAQTVLGGRGNVWRRGAMLGLETADGAIVERPHYLMLASTLTRLPTGIRPFGRIRDGLKVLQIDAPPRHIAASLPALLCGSEAPWLRRAGYHRIDTQRMRLTLDAGFILDGEAYPGGDIVLRQGEPIAFVVP